MAVSTFTVEDFKAAANPWEYLGESGLFQAGNQVPKAELLRLRETMLDLDEQRLAFALDIGHRESPELFALTAAHLLSHESTFVRLNAYNLLRSVSAEALTDELRQVVASELKTSPDQDHFADALER